MAELIEGSRDVDAKTVEASKSFLARHLNEDLETYIAFHARPLVEDLVENATLGATGTVWTDVRSAFE